VERLEAEADAVTQMASDDLGSKVHFSNFGEADEAEMWEKVEGTMCFTLSIQHM